MLDIISRLKIFSWKKLQIFIFITAIAALFFLANQYFPWVLNCIVLGLNQHATTLCLLRWAIILFMAVFWSRLICWIGHRYEFSKEKTAYWQAERLRIVLWLLIFELLICENILGKLFDYLNI